jgi:hypothetical protein
MNYRYVWRFNEPAPEDQDSAIRVRMENLAPATEGMPEKRVFEANLSVRPRALTGRNVLVTVLSFPFLTFKAFFAIYWQALMLLLKGVPFVPHPKGDAE